MSPGLSPDPASDLSAGLGIASTPMQARGSLDMLSALPELAPFVPSMLVQVRVSGICLEGVGAGAVRTGSKAAPVRWLEAAAARL